MSCITVFTLSDKAGEEVDGDEQNTYQAIV